MVTLATVTVAGGDYPIGSADLPDSRPEHTVRLTAFAIAKTTVTNAQFAAFVTAGGYQDMALWSEMGWRWQSHKQVTTPAFFDDPLFNGDDLPVVGICWYEAQAFAHWLSRETGQTWRLPTEAEWEAAARGHAPVTFDPTSIHSAASGIAHPVAADIGQVSWCGALQMCGNVWEWCSSRWGRNWQTLDYPYPYDPTDGRENPSGSHARVMRGGSWFDAPGESHPANRARYLPGSRGSNIGFRLVCTG